MDPPTTLRLSNTFFIHTIKIIHFELIELGNSCISYVSVSLKWGLRYLHKISLKRPQMRESCVGCQLDKQTTDGTAWWT